MWMMPLHLHVNQKSDYDDDDDDDAAILLSVLTVTFRPERESSFTDFLPSLN